MIVDLCRRISCKGFYYNIVFYIEGPDLRDCNFNNIHSENDIIRYFVTEMKRKEKMQVDIGLSLNAFKRISDKEIIKEINPNHFSILRVNSNEEDGLSQKFIDYQSIRQVNIEDIDILYKSIIPRYKIRWRDIEEFRRRHRTGIVNDKLKRYMRRFWVENYGIKQVSR